MCSPGEVSGAKRDIKNERVMMNAVNKCYIIRKLRNILRDKTTKEIQPLIYVEPCGCKTQITLKDFSKIYDDLDSYISL